MDLKERLEGTITVLSLKGSLYSEPDAIVLRERMNSLVEQGFRKVVLDLHDLTYVNSWGLGLLVALMSMLRRGGGDLRLARIAPHVQSLFIVTQLTLVFKTFDSVKLAVSSFESSC